MFKQIKALIKLNKPLILKSTYLNEIDRVAQFNRIVIDSSSFLDVVNSSAYVDKTMLIKDVMESNDKAMSFLSPRKFNKQTNLNMIKLFLEMQTNDEGNVIDAVVSNERDYLFKNESKGEFKRDLNISNQKEFVDKHLGKYPVVYLDLLNVKGESYEQILSGVKLAIHYAFGQHRNIMKSFERILVDDKASEMEKNEVYALLNEFKKFYIYEYKDANENDVKQSLKTLTRILYKHFKKKCVVLIYEYDSPLFNGIHSPQVDLNRVNDLIDGLLYNLIADNDYLEKALLTGIFSMRNNYSFELNDLKEYKFLGNHKYAKYFGFTSKEANKLLNKFDIDGHTRSDVNLWYNNYFVEDQHYLKMFNPWPMLNYIKSDGLLKNNWGEIEDFYNMNKVLKNNVIRLTLDQLIKDKILTFHFEDKFDFDDYKIVQDILNGKRSQFTDIFFAFLHELGYICHACSDNDFTFRIPNEYAKSELIRRVFN